ncbi:glutaredoxin family protein [Cyanobacterium sp. IPPAS B-1200]|uniref:glutaredoxin family protein n=1 Tax=Cyanobacterium sp. IPPAS B-1200 TaxID=1562720 RepID=UPI0008528C7E|nr:glutaredoxin family protein [Cyanobacterium sp. IPPAS B-1200]OEJ79096.1 glutaredoxin [Cyanobacterium sp. IPPAS B-1200]
MNLILYSKKSCHLCEGLEEKLREIDDININIEIRDITTNEQWFDVYKYEIPVLFMVTDKGDRPIPRMSPRISVTQLSKKLQQFANDVSDN